MKKLTCLALLTYLFAVAAYAQADTKTAAAAKLKVGDIAPDFTLTDTSGQKVKLSEFRGKSNVVLAFYVFAFTGG
jgi:cytochrome oxidase Cu insertion factor (SCO1/SenC/PrrC family)